MVPWDLLCFVSLNSWYQWQPISSWLMYILCSCWRVLRNHFQSWNSHHCPRGETSIWRMFLSLHISSTSTSLVILHYLHSLLPIHSLAAILCSEYIAANSDDEAKSCIGWCTVIKNHANISKTCFAEVYRRYFCWATQFDKWSTHTKEGVIVALK